MTWKILEDVNCDEQTDATACWLSAAKAVLNAINVPCKESIEELRSRFAGKSQEEVGIHANNAGVGDPTVVLDAYGVKCDKVYDKERKWGATEAWGLFDRLENAISKGVPVICSITSPQYVTFRHAVVVKGTNPAIKEILFSDPGTGAMRAVKMERLIMDGFLYAKAPLISLKTGVKKAKWDLPPNAYAYAYRFTFPMPLAKRV